jgi:hypothetical protein
MPSDANKGTASQELADLVGELSAIKLDGWWRDGAINFVPLQEAAK